MKSNIRSTWKKKQQKFRHWCLIYTCSIQIFTWKISSVSLRARISWHSFQPPKRSSLTNTANLKNILAKYPGFSGLEITTLIPAVLRYGVDSRRRAKYPFASSPSHQTQVQDMPTTDRRRKHITKQKEYKKKTTTHRKIQQFSIVYFSKKYWGKSYTKHGWPQAKSLEWFNTRSWSGSR